MRGKNYNVWLGAISILASGLVLLLAATAITFSSVPAASQAAYTGTPQTSSTHWVPEETPTPMIPATIEPTSTATPVSYSYIWLPLIARD